MLNAMQRPRLKTWLITAAVAFLGIGGLIAYLGRPTPHAVDETDAEMDELLVPQNPGYVGIAVCAECHAERADSVRKTRHALACRAAATGALAPGFTDGRGRFDSASAGIRFDLSRTGTACRAVGTQRTSTGEDKREYQIGLVYGSGGKRDEMYFAWEGESLFHLPIAWLYPFDRWGLGIDTIHAPATPPSCLECHNTWVGHVPGSPNMYKRDSMIMGVTCERCHGPGREHVEYHRAHPDSPAHSILHPGTLSRERLMDVCGQCHGNTRPTGRVFAYRPGQPLDANFRTFPVLHPEDGTTNQIGFLRASKCFQNSDMTCVTCHDPHRTKSAAGKCVQCHTAETCKEQPRLPADVRPNCVGCHMPERIWMHVHFYTTSDDRYLPIAPRSEHRIGIYPEARDAVLGTWLRKQAEAASRAEGERLCDRAADFWLAEGEKRVEARRFKAAIGAYRESLKLSPRPATRQRLASAISRQSEVDELVRAASSRTDPSKSRGTLEKLLTLKPDLAFAHGQLGLLDLQTGRRAEAERHFREIARCDPADNFGAVELARLALNDGRADEAAALCAEAWRIDAGHPGTHQLWGQALGKAGRWTEAAEQYRKALDSAPAHVLSNKGMSEAMLKLGDAGEAVRYARRAVHWGGEDNLDLLLTLADAYIAADRTDDARATLERAGTIAQAANAPQLAAIRERLRQL
jgi:tetratricopeptide (TPR) repeat protein